MQPSIRLRAMRDNFLCALLLVCACLLSPVVADNNYPSNQTGQKNSPQRIVVNSNLGADSAVVGSTTLAQALNQAANDPSDNLIAFDLAIFGTKPAVIQLSCPIEVKRKNAGHDRIDGKLTNGTIILDISSCPKAGIIVGGTGRLTLANLTVQGGKERAILVRQHGQLTLEKVTVRDSSGSGLAMFGQAKAYLTHCRLTKARFTNVDLNQSASLQLDNCIVEQSRLFGIFATGKTTIQLVNTDVRKNGYRGIELQDTARLTVRDSRVEANADYGIILFGESAIKATQTSVAHNAVHGVGLRDKASGQFTDCAFMANRYSGISCLDASNGGQVRITRCTFHKNGLRPIYRGPLHLDPLVPTPLRIDQETVLCLSEPRATIELFLDRTGEAAHYLKTIRADDRGLFQVDYGDIPDGWVITATATANNSTSEFNVIAGSRTAPILNALLANTGSLSDKPGKANLDTLLRRWTYGTHLVFNIDNPPSATIREYADFLAKRVRDWTGGAITAEVRIGKLHAVPAQAVLIPVRYVPRDTIQLRGCGGVTFMKWDTDGYFLNPMAITAAIGNDVQQTCPRVLAHEIGHSLGLSHTRIGLLSRMQGSTPCDKTLLNDFSPIMTFYDVLALHVLYDPRYKGCSTLRQLVERGAVPQDRGVKLADGGTATAQPSFSPPAPTANPR